MIRIAILDDEEIYLNEIQELVDSYIKSNHILGSVNLFQRADLLLYDLQDGIYYDIYLLDIELQDLNGLSIAKKNRNTLPNSIIIFITSHLQYAIDSFELSIFRYIPKPFLKDKLTNALKDAMKFLSVQSKEIIIIENSSGIHKIYYDDIIYIYKEKKYTYLVTTKDVIKVRRSLNEIYTELNNERFIYIDRGIVVNATHILQIKGNEIGLKNGEQLVISRPHLQDVKEKLVKFWGEYI